jgi:hypothetical protein
LFEIGVFSKELVSLIQLRLVCVQFGFGGGKMLLFEGDHLDLEVI